MESASLEVHRIRYLKMGLIDVVPFASEALLFNTARCPVFTENEFDALFCSLLFCLGDRGALAAKSSSRHW
jgi:hypothetical protein